MCRQIEAAQVIAELIELAKEIRQAQARGEDLGLTEDELAFYKALEVNDSAVLELGDLTLKAISFGFLYSNYISGSNKTAATIRAMPVAGCAYALTLYLYEV